MIINGEILLLNLYITIIQMIIFINIWVYKKIKNKIK
jgi:hypothetical protein